MSGSSVRIEPDRVVKQQPPEYSSCELTRTRWAGEIGLQSGLFRVPLILDHDPEKGEITFEKIRRAKPLRTLLLEPSKHALLERAARALAAIHSSSPGPGGGDGPSAVAWHGDFGVGNLLFTERDEELVIIDWCNATWTGEAPTRSMGPASFDLGVLLTSVFPRRIGGPGALPDAEGLANRFLASYAAASGSFDPAELRTLMPELTKRWKAHWIRNRGFLSALAYAPSRARMSRFVRRFEIDEGVK